jgi:hypothetical protein
VPLDGSKLAEQILPYARFIAENCLIPAGLIPRSLLRRNYLIIQVRHSRMHLAGIQAKL